MDASQLGRFIERIEMQTSLGQADVQTSAHAISISFTNSGTSTPLQLQISCEQLDWQLSSMAQVCDQFSPFLFRVKNLGINTTRSSSEQDDVDGEQWLELVRSFGGARDFWVAGGLTTDILCALRPAEGEHTTYSTVLPALRNLRVQKPMAIDEPLWDAAQSFITSRRLSSHPVELQVLCHICNTSFTQQQELKSHLVGKHAYRTVCSYCGDFECTPGHNRFPGHLRSKHPEVARNDVLISDLSLIIFPPSQLDRLVNRHSSLRMPDIVTPFTMVTAPHSQ